MPGLYRRGVEAAYGGPAAGKLASPNAGTAAPAAPRYVPEQRGGASSLNGAKLAGLLGALGKEDEVKPGSAAPGTQPQAAPAGTMFDMPDRNLAGQQFMNGMASIPGVAASGVPMPQAPQGNGEWQLPQGAMPGAGLTQGLPGGVPAADGIAPSGLGAGVPGADMTKGIIGADPSAAGGILPGASANMDPGQFSDFLQMFQFGGSGV